MFEKEFLLETSDVDAFNDLKLSALFRLFQDVATEHAELGGIGQSVATQKDMFWVITRYAVDIVKMPKYMQKVKVITYAGDNLKFLFPRYFRVEDEKGNVLVKASSTWVVLDRKTHKINMHPFDRSLPCEHYDGEEPLPERVIVNDPTFVEKRVIRYSDVDLNKHLNNTKYVEYIQDIHNLLFYEQYQIKHITINYNKEGVCDQTVVIEKETSSNKELVVGKIENSEIFTAEIEYVKRIS